MPVICAACQTENREHAMFCRGCAGKLPAFAATGPSVLEVMKAQHEAEVPGVRAANARPTPPGGSAGPMRPGTVLSAEMRSFWIRLGLLMLVVMLAFIGWSSYVTRKVPLRGQDIGVPFDSAAAGVPPRSAVATVVVVPPVSGSSASMPSTVALPATGAGAGNLAPGGAVATGAAAAAPASTPASIPASANSQAIAAAVAAAAAPPQAAGPAAATLAAPTAPAAVPAPVALSASLSPGESASPSGNAGATSRRPRLFTRHEARIAPLPPPMRVAGADPRQGCEGMNFIFAAHCEAVHCEEAAFSANPRCDAVRAQRQRDLARRNLEF